MSKIDLYHGDCLKIMEELANKGIKVDAVIPDVPFGITPCKWDSIIPFNEMWEKLAKITRPDTAIVLFGAEPFSSHLRLSNIENYKYDIVWDKIKGTGFLNAKKQPMRNHELISVFYEKQPTYNPQKTKNHKRKTSKSKKVGNSEVYGTQKSVVDYDSEERYPRSIQVFSTDTQKSSVHPTQKPVKLLEYLIKTYTNEGDLVLDFTMGSGTTMVACENTNRNGIGIELDDKYFKIAQDRVKEAKGEVGLFA